MLELIAGACVIESEEHVQFRASRIRAVAGDFIFKASFDKANRSSVSSYRGPGAAEGLRILIIDHNLKMIMALCDQVVVLHHGEKIAGGLPREVRVPCGTSQTFSQ